jgi:6-pyruvoyltetrahydropterin/6-carboxytetrahydropterin synthase
MYTISKEFHFSASHTLDTLAEGHPCKRLHGHNYVVELILQAKTLDEHGFVVDYTALKPFKQMIDDELDHRHLNDILPYATSAENIARYLYEWAKPHWNQVVAVRVSETPKTWAEYREGSHD